MKKIAIVCGSPSSEMLAPFEDESWQIWVLGNRLQKFKGRRVTKVFEIHDDLSEHGDALKYANWLASHQIPMIVGVGFPVKADHINVFPFQAANELYGGEYLTSSSAYMMALAILEGATHIGVYGVDMAVDDHEYFWQRPCMESWIGFAKGRGIEVAIPQVSSIGKCTYVEGRKSGGKPDFKKAPFTEADFLGEAKKHADQIITLRAKIKEFEGLIDTHYGAQQVHERLAKVARATEAGQDIKTLSETAVIK
jgi:hypothetical protein